MKFSLGNLGGTIMMGDSEIVRFKYRKDELQFIEKIDDSVRPLPPEFFAGQWNDLGLRCFFESLITPETRIGLQEELEKHGIKWYDPETIIRYSKGKCIHDLFWLKCDDDGPGAAFDDSLLKKEKLCQPYC